MNDLRYVLLADAAQGSEEEERLRGKGWRSQLLRVKDDVDRDRRVRDHLYKKGRGNYEGEK